MDYTLDGGLRIGEAAVTALPGTGSPISLDCAAGRFLLLCSEEADGTVQYTVSAYLPDGSLTGTYPVSIDAGDEARSILAPARRRLLAAQGCTISGAIPLLVRSLRSSRASASSSVRRC